MPGDSLDGHAPKVPKAKIMGASALGACLASVALVSLTERQGETSAATASHPDPTPLMVSSRMLSHASITSSPCAEEASLGRRALKGSS